MDAMLPVDIISLNDKTISTALLFFSFDFVKRNILMAMSIIVVQMAVQNLLSVKHRGQRQSNTYS